MASGIGSMQSTLNRLKRKVPNQNKMISIVYMDWEGNIDWPPEELINPRGVLVIPKPLTDDEWELYCMYEDQKNISSSSCSLSTNSSNQK